MCLATPPAEVRCDYAGLNHLGWVRRVFKGNEDVTCKTAGRRGGAPAALSCRSFRPFVDPDTGLIPSEYLFFYYSQRKAYRNQLNAGASRGEELVRLNIDLFSQLYSENPREALDTYRRYLMQRNASYLRLEAEAGTAFRATENEPDPFETPTGYHKIAVEVMSGLVSDAPRSVVVNVRNDKQHRGPVT